MKERETPLVLVHQSKGRTGHFLGHAQPKSHPLGERGFSRAQGSLKDDHGPGAQGFGPDPPALPGGPGGGEDSCQSREPLRSKTRISSLRDFKTGTKG